MVEYCFSWAYQWLWEGWKKKKEGSDSSEPARDVAAVVVMFYRFDGSKIRTSGRTRVMCAPPSQAKVDDMSSLLNMHYF